MTCTSNGVQIGNDYGSDFGFVDFVSAPGFTTLPANFRVSVDLGADGGFGAGIALVKASDTDSAYILIDAEGHVYVTIPPAKDSYANVPTSDRHHHLEMTVQGGNLIVTISGKTIGTYPGETYSVLALEAGSGTTRTTAYGTFSNCTITQVT